MTLHSGQRGLIGAFFDIDGTLLGPPSLERQFLRYLHWRRELGLRHWLRWFWQFSRHIWSNPLAATEGNKAHLAGVPSATVEAWSAWLLRQPLPLFPEALAHLEWHAVQGHSIFLISGTLRQLAEVIARQLPIPVIVCATELECVAGRWTGRADPAGLGEPVCGPAKALALERFAAEFRVDLGRSYAYGDRYADRGMLERVGHPAAVNPSLRLAWLAHRRGWPVLVWRYAPERVRHFRRRHLEESPALASLEMTATAGKAK